MVDRENQLLYNFFKTLKRAKQASKIWSKEKRQKDERTLKEVEEALDLLYTNEGYGYFSEDEK